VTSAAAGYPDVLGDRDDVRGPPQLLATLLGDQLRLRGQESGGAEVWAHGLVGMVESTAEWWLDHRTTSRAALVDDLAALAWGGIAGIFLAETGIVEELTVPIAPAPSTR
jgi:hypothetical protein